MTAGIEVDCTVDKALEAHADFESHSQWANTCIIEASFDMNWHPALAQGPKLNDCRDQKVVLGLQVKVDVLLGQC